MVKTSLVASEIDAGRTLFEHLIRHAELRIEAAFWWQEDEEWRFVITTPVVGEEGRLAVHRSIRRAIADENVPADCLEILDRLDVRDPREGPIGVLDVGSVGKVPLGRLVVRESVRGAYVEGA